MQPVGLADVGVGAVMVLRVVAPEAHEGQPVLAVVEAVVELGLYGDRGLHVDFVLVAVLRLLEKEAAFQRGRHTRLEITRQGAAAANAEERRGGQ